MEAAAWAQAIMSAIAIVVSGFIAVMIPYRERQANQKRADRSRLDITTTRTASNGLRLEIRYVPEFTHAALSARIAVQSPGAKLFAGRPVVNPAPMASGGYIRFEMDGQFIGSDGVVGLKRIGDPQAFTGVMFLLPDGSSGAILKNARIEATISNAGGEQLLTSKLFVSPIEEGPGTVFVEPLPIQPMFEG